MGGKWSRREGHRMTIESERELQPLKVVRRTVEPLMRSLAVGTIAGFFAGAITGGVGSRIAMRIVAITAGGADQGGITDAEATVGEITAGGTTFLLFVGGGGGALGGLLYLAVRRWLADAGRWRGLVFGLLLLAAFGSAIIEGDNPDFDEFGSPGLNIAMFASLFIIFGLLVAPLFERIERGLPRASLRPSGLGALAAYGFGLLLLLPALGSVGFLSQQKTLLLLLYALLAMPLAAYVLARANDGFERLSDLRGRPTLLAAALALLALPLVVGMGLDALALAEIY